MISRSKSIGLPAIVLGELRAGFLMGNKAEKNEFELLEFLSNPFVKILDVGEDASQIYAELVVDLKKPAHQFPQTTSGLRHYL